MGPGPRVERSLRLSFKLSKDIESLKQKQKNKDPYKRSFFVRQNRAEAAKTISIYVRASHPIEVVRR